MRGKVIREIKAIAKELSKDAPEMYGFYYKAAKKIYRERNR